MCAGRALEQSEGCWLCGGLPGGGLSGVYCAASTEGEDGLWQRLEAVCPLNPAFELKTLQGDLLPLGQCLCGLGLGQAMLRSYDLLTHPALSWCVEAESHGQDGKVNGDAKPSRRYARLSSPSV